jgi:hypothetical protein
VQLPVLTAVQPGHRVAVQEPLDAWHDAHDE